MKTDTDGRRFSNMNRMLSRSMKGMILVPLVFLLLPSAADACTRCFGLGVDNATTKGISMAMLGLLVMLGIVWCGIGTFFYKMKKRSDLREAGDWMVTEQGDIETHGK